MTVREWFRLQRRVLWERDQARPFHLVLTEPWDWQDLNRLVTKAIEHQEIEPWESLGPYVRVVFNHTAYAQHTRALETVRDRMQAAMDDLHQQLLRRTAKECFLSKITD